MAVEAAIVLPLLLVLALGTIEVALLLRDHVAATTFARAGARTASAEPRFGTNTAGFGHTGTGSTSSFAQDAADAMQRASSTLARDSIDFIRVYLANRQGYPSQTVGGWASDGTSDFSSCPPSTCVQYRWVEGTGGNPGRFTWQSGSWDPRTINACIGDNGVQSVGVLVQVDHPWVVGFFGGGSTKVRANTVMRFEPLTRDNPRNPADLPTATEPGFFPGCKP